MITRSTLDELIAWKASNRRKPLLLQGARQVGKTFLLKYWGNKHYDDVAYFNFEKTPELKKVFLGSLEPSNIIQSLSLLRNRKIESSKTLVILDEIQLSDGALASLKYFCEDAPEYHVAAAGSLLGVKLAHQSSFPVGKVNFIHLSGLSFFEFVKALGFGDWISHIQDISAVAPLQDPIHDKWVEWLRLYLILGGMPEVVQNYIDHNDFAQAREIQLEILESYQRDFSKYATPEAGLKIAQLWGTIPQTLAKEQKRFHFSSISTTARAREYAIALQWLVDAGLVLRSNLVETARVPLLSYKNTRYFKLYLLDSGLLCALSRLEPKIVLEGSALFTEFKGALSENFVAQEISRFQPLYYWQSAREAEVDFLIEAGEEIIPLEVKAGYVRGIKSLREFQRKFKSQLMVRTSLFNLRQDQGDFINLPLYMVSRLFERPLTRGPITLPTKS